MPIHRGDLLDLRRHLTGRRRLVLRPAVLAVSAGSGLTAARCPVAVQRHIPDPKPETGSRPRRRASPAIPGAVPGGPVDGRTNQGMPEPHSARDPLLDMPHRLTRPTRFSAYLRASRSTAVQSYPGIRPRQGRSSAASATPLAVIGDTDHSSGGLGLCRRNLSWFRTLITVRGTAMTKISPPSSPVSRVRPTLAWERAGRPGGHRSG